MKLYDQEFVANIKLESLEKPVQLAALDLQKTLRALSGKPKGFVMTAVGQIVLAVAPGHCTVEVTDEAVRITAPEAEKMADAIALFEKHWLDGLEPAPSLTLKPGYQKG